MTPLVPVIDERLESIAKQNPRKERWKSQYPRVFATVSDARGEVFEVRHVNQNRQLAFWDPHLNIQTYVYPRKNSEQLETKEKSVLTIVR